MMKMKLYLKVIWRKIMGRRKYVDTCCSSCGRETSAWQRDKYPLCNKCDMDSPENIRKYRKYEKGSKAIWCSIM
jgi:predicted amidophosphoribosyltransferase